MQGHKVMWSFAVLFMIVNSALTFLVFNIFISPRIEQPPITYKNVPFPIEGKPEPGKALPLTITRCNHTGRQLSYQFYRSLNRLPDGQTDREAIIIFPLGGSSMPPGDCETVRSEANVLPDDLLPGRYYITATTVVKGESREFEIPWSTQVFEVGP